MLLPRETTHFPESRALNSCISIIYDLNRPLFQALCVNIFTPCVTRHTLCGYAKIAISPLKTSSFMNTRLLETISQQISQLLPREQSEELKHNIQQVLARQLNKLDLVSRDEFDAQQAVLLRTREKLEALEKQVAELEKLNDKG